MNTEARQIAENMNKGRPYVTGAFSQANCEALARAYLALEARCKELEAKIAAQNIALACAALTDGGQGK